jgi:prepilin-type N-terminal cleavage/methylation domain-containing protein
MEDKMKKVFLTGFTLIELMLVVIIIGVLSAMVVPRLAGRSEQAVFRRPKPILIPAFL